MDPFRTDPLNPLADGVPGDPMEEVLALQSYSLGDGEFAADCQSNVSCPSNQSCLSNTSGSDGGDIPIYTVGCS